MDIALNRSPSPFQLPESPVPDPMIAQATLHEVIILSNPLDPTQGIRTVQVVEFVLPLPLEV